MTGVYGNTCLAACVAEQTSKLTLLYDSTQHLHFAKRRDKQIHGVVTEWKAKNAFITWVWNSTSSDGLQNKRGRRNDESGHMQIRERPR